MYTYIQHIYTAPSKVFGNEEKFASKPKCFFTDCTDCLLHRDQHVDHHVKDLPLTCCVPRLNTYSS